MPRKRLLWEKTPYKSFRHTFLRRATNDNLFLTRSLAHFPNIPAYYRLSLCRRLRSIWIIAPSTVHLTTSVKCVFSLKRRRNCIYRALSPMINLHWPVPICLFMKYGIENKDAIHCLRHSGGK